MKPLDTDLLLSTGALMGPYRRTHAVTVTWRMRITRALRRFLLNHRSP